MGDEAISAYNASQERLREIFRRVDKDNNGYISADELQNALSNGTWSAFNPETVRLMIGMFDRKNRGSVGFEEFGPLWKYVTDWQKCFLTFDTDKSGNIDKEELKKALISFGYKLSDSLIQILMNKFDRFGNGTILFDDFIQCCVMLYAMSVCFASYDTDRDGIVTLHYEQFLNMTLTARFQRSDANFQGYISIHYEEFMSMIFNIAK